MKKLLMFSALAVIIGAPVAIAQGFGGDPEGKGGQRRGPDPDKMVERLFGRHDADGDGFITKEEFLKVGEEHFAKMDADGDGKVTKEEAKKPLEEMKNRSHDGENDEAAPMSPEQ